MKWVWIFVLFCFCQNVAAQQTSNTVRLMSYNIRLDNAGDNENNWHHRKADLSKYLEDSGADFIGLQEAIGHQLYYLDESLVEYNYLGVARDDGAVSGEYSPILYNSTEWKVEETNTFWLSATPNRVSRGWDAACHRVCTYGLFVHKTSADTIMVLNTHFDHVGKIARAESIQLINDFIQQFEDGLPIVLMGDFNFTPDDQNYLALTNALADSYDLVVDKSAPSGTFNGWKSDQEAKRRIDYILHNKEIQIINYSVDHPKTTKERQLSDHYPVAVEIRFDDK